MAENLFNLVSVWFSPSDMVFLIYYMLKIYKANFSGSTILLGTVSFLSYMEVSAKMRSFY